MTKLIRTWVLLAVTVFGGVTFVPGAVAQNDTNPPAAKDDANKNEPAKDAEAKDAAAKDAAAKDDAKTTTEPTPTPTPTPTVEPPKPPPFVVRKVETSDNSTIGSLDPAKDMLRVTLSQAGAAIKRVETSKYKAAVGSDEPYIVLQELRGMRGGREGVLERPFSALSVTIDGAEVTLWDKQWELVSDGVYRVHIDDQNGNPVLQITRSYTLGDGAGGYDITCSTQFQNLTQRDLVLVWKQHGLGDVERDADYRGDTRMFTAGYFDLEYDPQLVHVYSGEGHVTRVSAMSSWLEDRTPLWPVEQTQKYKLLWLGMSDRYFAGVMHRPVPKVPEGVNARAVGEPLDEIFQPFIGLEVAGEQLGKTDMRVMVTNLTSRDIKLEAGKTHALDLCLYAGPRLDDVLGEHPYVVLGMNEHLIKYDMGCTICMFQWLADFLLWFLEFLRGIVFDWGMAIIILVIVVRLLLHPITKKAQINMTKMSKQMAKMQPEMAKIKEKYKNDPQKQQAEMMKLYREHGVSPMGFLGCLPMFLQMPIWIALYAMLYGAIELRHQHAFWGIFQSFGDWAFLRDLSSPDFFIQFAPGGFNIPLCGIHINYALNVLPILMGVLFYFQQKLTTPPPANEQQAQQQKIMKYMMLLFPLFFYSAPSGLTLYIMASSIGGMIDGYYVRKHIKREEEAGTLFKKKEPKPGGFFDRMQKMLEAKQREMEEKRGGGGGGGGGRRGGKKRK